MNGHAAGISTAEDKTQGRAKRVVKAEAPRAVLSGDLMHLQRTIGNSAINALLRQYIVARSPGGDDPSTKPAPAEGSLLQRFGEEVTETDLTVVGAPSATYGLSTNHQFALQDVSSLPALSDDYAGVRYRPGGASPGRACPL